MLSKMIKVSRSKGLQRLALQQLRTFSNETNIVAKTEKTTGTEIDAGTEKTSGTEISEEIVAQREKTRFE